MANLVGNSLLANEHLPTDILIPLLKSEASKTEGELTAAKRLYQSVNLQGAAVTGDALFLPKGNQATSLAEAECIAAVGAPLLPAAWWSSPSKPVPLPAKAARKPRKQ